MKVRYDDLYSILDKALVCAMLGMDPKWLVDFYRDHPDNKGQLLAAHRVQPELLDKGFDRLEEEIDTFYNNLGKRGEIVDIEIDDFTKNMAKLVEDIIRKSDAIPKNKNFVKIINDLVGYSVHEVTTPTP